MSKNNLIVIISILEGWFYLASLVITLTLWRFSLKLTTPVMQPYRPLFQRLSVALSSLIVSALLLVLYVVTGKKWWGLLIFAEIFMASSFSYFVFKLPSSMKTIQKSSDLNELRFIESNKFKAIFANSPDAIIAANAKSQIVDWNLSAENMFGHKEEDIVGKSLTLIMPERYREAHLRGMRYFVETGEKRLIGKTVKIEGLKANGEEFPIELSLSSYGTRTEQRFVAIIRDVTNS